MKQHGGVEAYFCACLMSGLGGDERSFSFTGLFTPGENIPPYPLDRNLDGLQSPSGRCEGQKNVFPLLRIEPDSFVVQPVA
jgi:hypothetical protein